jgi:hypothetical protein
VNKYCLTGADLGSIDQTLPGRNRNQRKGGRLPHRKILWLVREQVSIYSDELRQCPLQAANPTNHAIDLIALPKCRDSGANVFDDTSHINAKHGRKRLLCM